MRLARLIGPELETLLRESPAEVRELLDEIHPEDFADIVAELDDQRAMELLTELPTDYAAQVFERLDEDRQEALAHVLGTDETAKLVSEMGSDEAADFVSMLPPAMVAPILESLERVDPEAAEDVEELARWPDSSAGGLMTTDFVAVSPQLRMSEALEVIRHAAQEAETLDSIYVLDTGERLVGFLTLRILLLADPTERVHDAMLTNVISVPPQMDQEEVAQKLAKYDFNTLPVVSEKGQLLGVITSDDIMDVMNEEQAEDVHKMGAIEPIRDGYFDASFFEYIRKRAPWLVILFIGGYFTTTAMEAYGAVLAAVAELAVYVPLLIAAGGNSGSQSSTLVIRGLAVGDIAARDWHRVFGRELAQGALLGLMLAVLGVLRVVLAGGSWPFAGLIALTIVAIVVMGCVVGGMMPLLLHRVGVDPATSSTPFIATVVDVLGILIYLTLARWLLTDLATTLAPG
jgi:magnesium transporter